MKKNDPMGGLGKLLDAMLGLIKYMDALDRPTEIPETEREKMLNIFDQLIAQCDWLVGDVGPGNVIPRCAWPMDGRTDGRKEKEWLVSQLCELENNQLKVVIALFANILNIGRSERGVGFIKEWGDAIARFKIAVDKKDGLDETCADCCILIMNDYKAIGNVSSQEAMTVFGEISFKHLAVIFACVSHFLALAAQTDSPEVRKLIAEAMMLVEPEEEEPEG